MSKWEGPMVWLFLIGFLCGGCASPPLEKREALSPGVNDRLSNIRINDLAGAWEYHEANVVYPLVLDPNGKGSYDWKNGYFETTSVSDGVWRGIWRQIENDREGGFELRLAPDSQTGTGLWWYTRIGKDHTPLEPGGTFTLKRPARKSEQ